MFARCRRFACRRFLAAAVAVAGSAATGRADPGVLAIGGHNGTVPLGAVQFFNTGSSSWSGLASLPAARSGVSAAPVTIGSAVGVLAVGGHDGAAAVSTVYFYNPSANAWTTRAASGQPRHAAATASLTSGGVAGVLTLGGTLGGMATSEFYDPVADSWSPRAGPVTARFEHAAAPLTMGGVAGVLSAGGYGAAPLASAEFYDPAANTWTAAAAMANAREGCAAAPVTVGGVAGVLVAGGYNGNSYVGPTEFFNPTTNAWTVRAALPTSRYLLSAAPAVVGGVTGVLAVGGFNFTMGAGVLAVAEFYNPGANTWTAMPAMPTARYYLAAAPADVPTLSPTVSGTPTPCRTATRSATPTFSGTSTVTASATITLPISLTVPPLGSFTATATSSAIASPTASSVPTATASASPSPSPAATASASATAGPAATGTRTQTSAPTASAGPTGVATSTAAATATPWLSATASESCTSTATPHDSYAPRVHPNPARIGVRLVVLGAEPGSRIDVLNVRGESARGRSFAAGADGSAGIETAGLAAGIHVVRIRRPAAKPAFFRIALIR